MTAAIIERHRHVASLVLRPVDALRRAMGRPAFERGPVTRTDLTIVGEVAAGVLQPLTRDLERVRNLSGDTVYRDLSLDAGRYRLALLRGSRAHELYEELDAADRDFDWDPDAPFRSVIAGRPHPSLLVELPLCPAAPYPFPAACGLIRGAVTWYDGAALTGAVLREAGALIPRSVAGPRGDFVLAYGNAAAGTVDITIDHAAVAAAAKPQGGAYLANWPPSFPNVQWTAGSTATVRQAALRGTVLTPEGRPATGATATLAGHPGVVSADSAGTWCYRFPPGTADGAVDATLQHPAYAAIALNGLPIRASATTLAPTTRFA